jgi:phosphoglycerate dehydrogenase-like enzyme
MSGPVVASQFGIEFDERLRQARPDIQVLTLPRELEWPLPREASVLLATIFTAERRSQAEPPGWPFGLRWTQLVSIGIDAYPAWFLRRPLVTTARGVSAQTIAEYVLACVLRHALRLDERRVDAASQWRLVAAPGVAGRTLGLYGFGGIGQAVARKALALGMKVLALRRGDAPLEVPGVERAASLEALLSASDHLVLAAPGTHATRHVIASASLAHAKHGLHLVNVARGSLVDQEALRVALDEGRVGFASLDVTVPEPLPDGHWLYTHPRVQLTSHTCAIGPQVQDALLDKVLRGLQAFERGDTPGDVVNLERGY